MKIEFDQIIVLVILLACIALMVTGVDGEVKSVFVMGCGWVFKGVYEKAVPAIKKTLHKGKEEP